MNFLGLTGIGYVINFYLLFDLAAMPILSMTLRNNLLRAIAPHKIPPDVLSLSLFRTQWLLSGHFSSL